MIKYQVKVSGTGITGDEFVYADAVLASDYAALEARWLESEDAVIACADAILTRSDRIQELEAALRSIAANTCCETCQEAALVARSALETKDERCPHGFRTDGSTNCPFCPDMIPRITHVSNRNDLTREQRIANAATHKTRMSDSSLYDEVCKVCGARDWTLGPDEIGDAPCSARQSEVKHGR